MKVSLESEKHDRTGKFSSDFRPAKFHGLSGVRLWMVLLLIGVSAGPLVNAQERAKKKVLREEVWKRGFHGFAQLLRNSGFQLLSSVSDLEEYASEETAVVAFGDVDRHRQFLQSYIRQGGNLLIATDYQFGNFRTSDFELQVYGRAIASSVVNSFGNDRDSPTIENFSDSSGLSVGIREVATNRPARLYVRGRSSNPGRIVSVYPPLMEGGTNQPFLFEHESDGQGRLLIVPDQTLFNNAMINRADNLQFSLNLIDWLKQKPCKHCLFLIGDGVSVPWELSQLELWQPAPDAQETMEILRELWKHTTPREKLDLTNEALQFAQEEGLLEELVDSMSLSDFMSQNRILATLIFIAGWGLVICFVMFLMSSRATPLSRTTIDGLGIDRNMESNRRETAERFRAAEALFVHFFTTKGISIRHAGQVDVSKIKIQDDRSATRKLRKEMEKFRQQLERKQLEFWTEERVEDLGRMIGTWNQFFDSGKLIL